MPLAADGDFPEHLQVLPADTLRALTGVLRSAALLFEQIVVPYSHLVDGSWLLALGPDGVASVLGLERYEPLPFVVAGPHSDLREILRVMSVSPGKSQLEPAIWSCASLLAIEPNGLARELARRDSTAIRDAAPAQLPGVIALELQAAAGFTAQAPTGAFAELADAWSDWADARGRGRVGYSPMQRSGELMRASRHKLAPAPRPTASDPDAWRTLVERVTDAPSRSDVHLATGEATEGVDENDSLTLRAWWQGSYERVIAEGAHASWARFTSDEDDTVRALTAVGEDAAWAEDISISLTGSIFDLLADMTPGQYRQLRHQLRGQRDRWLAHPTPAHARDLAYGIASSRAASDRRADTRRSVLTIGVSTGSAVVGVLVGWLAGFSGGTLAIGLAVVGAIVTGPVNDLLRTQRFTRADLDSVIRHPVAR